MNCHVAVSKNVGMQMFHQVPRIGSFFCAKIPNIAVVFFFFKLMSLQYSKGALLLPTITHRNPNMSNENEWMGAEYTVYNCKWHGR